MQHTTATQAFSSAESVREIALQVMRMSEAIHQALRKYTSASPADPSRTSAYALLTEEYALRARASMLLIEATRLARPEFPVSQADVLATLTQVEARLSQSSSLDELSELITGLLLFTSSIISRNNRLVSILIENLDQAVAVA
jgi:hypothetical protein